MQLICQLNLATYKATAGVPGDCALVEARGLQNVLITQRSQTMGVDLYSLPGCDRVCQRRATLKSSEHVRAASVRHAGIYDTRFGTDENAGFKPQRAEGWTERGDHPL